ncbi:four-helix bundle copper-binding protein [Aquimarina agarilytica]|uniref:four-helix bundle copper-binding protein n=1 Tax=Aquimarina agarilytica TaxID=1087449 RepID=UPI0002893786|nr:four-helix bundle copper-binding protein [Aquimarina agarilytica]
MKNQKLIDALNKCISHCNYCADACLETDNIKMMVDCIRTDRACAEICATTVKLLAMNSAFAKAMVEKCHEICNQCADECSKHDHQHCKDCADACKKCADACKAYLA